MNPAFVILPLLLLFPFVLLLDFKGRLHKALPYIMLAYLSLVLAFFFFRIVPFWALPILVLVTLAVYFALGKKVNDPK